MNVVYVLQSGPGGPVTIGTATDRGLHRRIRSLQAGNPVLLQLVHLFDGDERLERQLHVDWTPHRLRGDWYRPEALEHLPDNLPTVHHDNGAESRRQAAATLADLAPRT